MGPIMNFNVKNYFTSKLSCECPTRVPSHCKVELKKASTATDAIKFTTALATIDIPSPAPLENASIVFLSVLQFKQYKLLLNTLIVNMQSLPDSTSYLN